MLMHNSTNVKPDNPACPTTLLPDELPQDDIDPLVAELYVDLKDSLVKPVVPPVAPKKAPKAPSPAPTAPADDTTAADDGPIQTFVLWAATSWLKLLPSADKLRFQRADLAALMTSSRLSFYSDSKRLSDRPTLVCKSAFLVNSAENSYSLPSYSV